MIQENPEVVGPSELVEDVLVLLEGAEVPEEICDRIVRQIEAWEAGREVCEHDVIVGDWCELCRLEYGEAQSDPENGNGE